MLALKEVHDIDHIHKNMDSKHLLLTPDHLVKLCSFGWEWDMNESKEKWVERDPYLPPEFVRGGSQSR